MAVIVELPHVSVSAEVEILERDRGHAWRAAIIDRHSRETLEFIDMKGSVHETRSDAVNDAESKMRAHLRVLQEKRDAARAASKA